MVKKTLITAFMLIFSILASSFTYADHLTFGSSTSFDVSIDRVAVNGQALSQSRNNLINDADTFLLQIDVTAVKFLENGHVEAALRGRVSNDVVADSTGTFDLFPRQSTSLFLFLVPKEGLEREHDFELTVKVIDAKGRSEQKTFGVKTKQTTQVSRRQLDVSIDRVKVNGKAVASSSANFVEESNAFDVLVEFTALQHLDDAHVEAILKDTRSGDVVADSTGTFDLKDSQNSSKLLRLELLDHLKQSASFELAVRVVDAEGDSVKQTYGIRMRDGATTRGALDISVDSVELEEENLAENQNNFVLISDNKKEVDLEVRLTSLESIKNARIEAILAFENGDVVADATATFNINKDEKTIKKLELPLITKVSQENYRLKLRIIDTDGNTNEKSYGLKLSRQKLPFSVSGISLSPDGSIQAGRSLGVEVSLKNNGLPSDGIAAKASVAELNIQSTKFIDVFKNRDKQLIKEDFVLKIPSDVQPGTYTLRVELSPQSGNDKIARELQFVVTSMADAKATDSVLINVPVLKQDMRNDGSNAVFPLVLTNNGAEAKSYTISLDGAGWADLKLSDSSTFVVKPSESKNINVLASTKAKVFGEQIFLVAVESNDKPLQQIALKGNVFPAQNGFGYVWKMLLMVILILTAIALAALGLFYGLRGYLQKNKEEAAKEDVVSEIPDAAQGEAYY